MCLTKRLKQVLNNIVNEDISYEVDYLIIFDKPSITKINTSWWLDMKCSN